MGTEQVPGIERAQVPSRFSSKAIAAMMPDPQAELT